MSTVIVTAAKSKMDRESKILRLRAGKKGSITKRIDALHRLIEEGGSRTKIKYLLDALHKVHEETKELCEELNQLIAEPDNEWMEAVTLRVDICASDVQDYINQRVLDPPSTDCSMTESWVLKHANNEEDPELIKDLSSLNLYPNVVVSAVTGEESISSSIPVVATRITSSNGFGTTSQPLFQPRSQFPAGVNKFNAVRSTESVRKREKINPISEMHHESHGEEGSYDQNSFPGSTFYTNTSRNNRSCTFADTTIHSGLESNDITESWNRNSPRGLNPYATEIQSCKLNSFNNERMVYTQPGALPSILKVPTSSTNYQDAAYTSRRFSMDPTQPYNHSQIDSNSTRYFQPPPVADRNEADSWIDDLDLATGSAIDSSTDNITADNTMGFVGTAESPSCTDFNLRWISIYLGRINH